MKTYHGLVMSLEPNQVFVFGSNPEGRHGAGAAKAAMAYGAIYGIGRGHMGQTYGLVTKNLKPNYTEALSDITYIKAGERSVSKVQIVINIFHLYLYASKHPELDFLIGYTVSDTPNLNGYTTKEMAEMFAISPIPDNIVFNDEFYVLVNEYKNRTSQKTT